MPTLLDLAEELEALLDTEDLVSPEQRPDFDAEMDRAVERTLDKCDRIKAVLIQWEGRDAKCLQQIGDIRKYRRMWQNRRERLRRSVQRVLEHRNWSKLAGASSRFSLQPSAEQPRVVDPVVLPERYQDVTVTMPADLWQQLTSAVTSLQEQGRVQKIGLNQSRLKQDLQAGQKVPGAVLERSVILVVR